jgi:hypothetical protein
VNNMSYSQIRLLGIVWNINTGNKVLEKKLTLVPNTQREYYFDVYEYLKKFQLNQ